MTSQTLRTTRTGTSFESSRYSQNMDDPLVVNLFSAVSSQSLPQMVICIDAGVDVNCKLEQSGRTPLHLTIENGHYDGFIKLIDAGADINS